ncbi:MAG: acyl-CoA dehydrogenase, partial [Desulfosalsimonas sp.]
GTNGIQAIDLMGRKMRINDGAMFAAFAKEMENFIDARRDHDHLGGHVRDLENAFARAQKKGRKNEFFRGKVAQATFFADTVLPHTIERAGTCTRQGREIVEIADTAF